MASVTFENLINVSTHFIHNSKNSHKISGFLIKLVPVGSFFDSLKLGADELSSRGAQQTDLAKRAQSLAGR